ncbi:MAG: hypothetical protein JST39_12405 [Bacteroidetes bacterium]|nr:hypothetical protein [Bacteroidota bacterium]
MRGYLFKHGDPRKENIQDLHTFGAELKISIITVFILVGLIFIFAGTYMNIVNANAELKTQLGEQQKRNRDLDTHISELDGQIKALKVSQNKTLDYFLDLDGQDDAIPNVSNLRICYRTWGDEDREIPLTCKPLTFNEKKRLQVTLSNLTPETFVTAFVVKDVGTNHQWRISNFYPLSPALRLNRIEATP